ncbi:uncharacterized protein LOC143376015 [Andrena cerasifolii]|uniref:uncharacterized protein LOC143376015 n=1 Tax=Andrena cerasifolii TaxID=2819439 RepID=UPI0040377485
MKDVLEEYERYLRNRIDETDPCSCSQAMPNAYHQPRKGPASGHRHSRRIEHDPTFLPALEAFGNSEAVDSVETGCGRVPSTRNGFKKGNHWRGCQVRTEPFENFDYDSDTLAKSAQRGRDRVPRSEPRISRQPTEQTSKLVLTSAPLENVEDDREEAVKRNDNSLVPATVNTVRPTSTRRSDLQASLKCNADDASKLLDDGQKQTEGARFCKTRKPAAILRSSACRPNDEFPIIREEIQEDTHCEILVKGNDRGATVRKNVYAGGDLDLHASKNHILGLIDRALSNEFGTSMDPEGSMDPGRELTQQEICIEITRAMQGDCCQTLAEDLLSHRGPKADYIKHLKILRWEHMNHIQEEFRKLCSLQKFLDNCSPRQSLPTVQPHLGAVEQRPEERLQQQQRDEKLPGTIS